VIPALVIHGVAVTPAELAAASGLDPSAYVASGTSASSISDHTRRDGLEKWLIEAGNHPDYAKRTARRIAEKVDRDDRSR
jgi:hypothetical protein